MAILPLATWSLFFTLTSYDSETVLVRSDSNWTQAAISVTGYDNSDYPSQSTRENSCFGAGTSEPSWSYRVSTLYTNQVSVTFSYQPNFSVPAMTSRKHEIVWNIERYGEAHRDVSWSGTIPTFQSWEDLIEWLGGEGSGYIAARGEIIFRGINVITFKPIEPVED